MRQWTRWTVTGVAAASLLMMGGSVFASANEPSQALTIDYISAPTLTGGNDVYTVKISGLVPSTTAQTYYVGFRYGNLPTGTQPNGDDKGTQVTGTLPVGSSTSQKFQIAVPASKDTGNLDVAEYNSPSFSPGEHDGAGQETRQESAGVALPTGSTPYGQLPEVPFAAVIPVVGLGAAVLLRRKLVH